jgi:hypothetical protein
MRLRLSLVVSACLMVALAVQSAAQSGLPPEVLNLSKIRRQATAAVAQAPNYACLETVERYARENPNSKWRQLDTLLLEVGMIGGKEIYAWPGSESFDDVAPGEIVSSGTVSTGEFVQLLRAVFVGGTAVIKWHGEEEVNGRRALRYDYTLPLYGYRSRVTLSTAAGDLSLKGSFWADAETFEILRLESEADEVPPTLPLVSMRSRIDYGRMTVHGRQVWFPQSAEMSLSELSGQETRNRIEFSHCRAYSGESKLSFGEVTAPAIAAAAPVERVELPAGVALELRLETAIDSSKVRVGDEVRARLASDAVYRKRVLIPAGAVVTGRLRRLERSDEIKPHFVVGLEFATIETGLTKARFYGELESVQQVAGLARSLTTSSAKSVNFSGGMVAQGFRVESGSATVLHFREIPGVGSFYMVGTQFTLPQGLKMIWKTLEQPKRRRQ